MVAFALGDPKTPWRLRIAGAAFILYLMSPVDLIPLWVPVAGLLDDLILVPWGLSVVVRRLPPGARDEAEAAATRFIRRWVARPALFLVLLLVVLVVVWMAFLGLLWWLLRS